jgi:TRAP-type C4-dicarboxylate transport system substrate-binding protein
MYEKELTMTSSAFLNSQQQQQRLQIEAMEKTVQGYRELVERLEADLEKAVKGSGNQIHHYSFIHLAVIMSSTRTSRFKACYCI